MRNLFKGTVGTRKKLFGLMAGPTCFSLIPLATPPNAIIYASRQVTIPEMARTGFWLNLTGILIIIAFVVFLLPLLWEFQPNELPVEFNVIPGKKVEP